MYDGMYCNDVGSIPEVQMYEVGTSDITDGCDLPNNTVHFSDGVVYYNSPTEIRAFQFTIVDSVESCCDITDEQTCYDCV